MGHQAGADRLKRELYPNHHPRFNWPHSEPEGDSTMEETDDEQPQDEKL